MRAKITTEITILAWNGFPVRLTKFPGFRNIRFSLFFLLISQTGDFRSNLTAVYADVYSVVKSLFSQK